MSFDSCLLSERLTTKLPVAQLRRLAKKYTKGDVTPAAAMQRVLAEQLELTRMEERNIIKAVRTQYEARGGKVRSARAQAAAVVDPAPITLPEPAPAATGPAKPVARGARAVEDSPAFRKWFGESKAIDAAGAPLVLYHGTNSDITEMKSRGELFPSLPWTRGIYFTPDAKYAAAYADGEGGNVMPVYLSLQNPKVITDGVFASASISQAQVDEMRAEGFDGIINQVDNEYIVFDSTQVKSATGNAGTFDPANPNILASRAQLVDAASAAAGRSIDAAVLSQKVSSSVEAILRRPNASASELREAIRNISLTGPKDVRRLAAQVTKLLPDTGVQVFVDDASRPNLHGAVQLSPVVSLRLFTAGTRTGLSYATLLHEALHVAVAARYRSLAAGIDRGNDQALGLSAPAAAAALEQFESVWTDFRDATRGETFADSDIELAVLEARGNPDEFFVRALTDPLLQSYMAGKAQRGKTLWQRFKDWVAKSLLGGTAPTWLDAALAASETLAQAMEGDRADFSRMGAVDPTNADTMASGMPPPMPRPAPTWSQPGASKLDDVIYTLQDKHIDMKRMVQQIRSEAGALEDKWDPYLQEEMFHGRSATSVKFFLNDELRPLLTDMKARGVEMAEFEQFLHMRHAEEANAQVASINPDLPDGGSGINTQDAVDYLANLTAAKRTAYEALAKRVDAMIKETQRQLVDYGLENQSAIDAWNGKYKHYVPLKREDMDGGQTGNGTGAGFSTRGPASQRRMGSTLDVVDILANIAMARETAIVRGEKNRLGVSLYGLTLKAPNPKFWKPINPQKSLAALRTELAKAGLPPELADNFIEHPTKRAVRDVPGGGNNPSQQQIAGVAAPTREQVVRVKQMIQGLDNVIAVRINGEDRYIFFEESNPRALRMAQTLKNIGVDQLGGFSSVMGMATRYFAAVNTQYNPIFGAVNLVRDFWEGGINLSSTPLAGKQPQFAAEVTRLFAKSVAARGRLGNMTGADAALWKEFQEHGGTTGFRAMFNTSEDRSRELMREMHPDRWMESKWGKVFTVDGKLKVPYSVARKVSTPVFDWLSDYNEALENVTRMAAYKLGREQGMSAQQSASLAKNLTVNFNRKGAVTAQVGAWYAFFNAATQGIARMMQTLASPAGKRIMAGGLLLGVMQAVMLAVAGFDDDELPEFVKSRNFIIPLGWSTDKKDYVSVPLPLGFNFLPNIGRLLTQYGLGGGKHTGRYLTHFASTLIGTFAPISGGSLAQTMTPTVADPVIDLWGNQDWTGKPIAREDMSSLNPTPGYTRAKDTASAIGKGFSYYANLSSGGTDYKPGMFSPTPDQVDYLIGQLTGGVGREAIKVQQTASALVSGEDLPAYKIPLAGRFYGDASDKSGISTKFYENMRQLAGHGAEIEGRREDKIETAGYLAEYPEARLAPKSEAYMREISQMRARRRELLEKKDRVRVMEIELKIRRRMESLNAEVEAARKTAP